MRLIYMGTPDFAVPPMEALVRAGHEIVYAVTQPDAVRDRGKKIKFSPVKEKALELGIPVLQPARIKKNEEFFQTIRDADYELPGQMEDVLRPYQTYGYKWLRTLQAAGFGGILADEMGLGKTIQAIALFRAWHEEGLKAPVLVVCPASLVYNWQEEIRRFAPEVTTSVMAGSADERKAAMKVLASSKAGRFPEINIISYDLLRRDIALFEKVSFYAILIDEAQYIKNQKAAMTKAVKGLKADYRLALTGTPIENKLAELWSIFDFLMPGFLYDYTTFSERFEAPIVKSKDKNASDKLKQMVGPFILRRLKTDVLKDLPEKLEEVRYARFDETQRKVYDGQVVLMRNLIGKSAKAGEEKLRILAELTRLWKIIREEAPREMPVWSLWKVP